MWVRTAVLAALLEPTAAISDDHWNALTPDESAQGYELLFNGKNLDGWDGDPARWTVENGTIVGSSDLHPLRANSFLISRQEFEDFVLRFEVKLRNGNSGMQFRSEQLLGWSVRGYQVDFAEGKGWGSLHGEGLPRKLILDAWQDKSEFAVRPDWNAIELYCQGHHIRIKVNGLVVLDVLDPGATRGVLAMQLHRGPPMHVAFRNIRLRQLSGK